MAFNEYIARKVYPDGRVRTVIIEDSPIDIVARKCDEKQGIKYEILEKLHPNWDTDALKKYC